MTADSAKLCRHCHQTKPADAFPRNPKVSDGLSSWCRACHRLRSAQWYRDHLEQARAAARARYQRRRAADRGAS